MRPWSRCRAGAIPPPDARHPDSGGALAYVRRGWVRHRTGTCLSHTMALLADDDDQRRY